MLFEFVRGYPMAVKPKKDDEAEAALQAVEEALTIEFDETDEAEDVTAEAEATDDAEIAEGESGDGEESDGDQTQAEAADDEIDFAALEEKIASATDELRAEDQPGPEDQAAPVSDARPSLAARAERSHSAAAAEPREVPAELAGTRDPVFAANDDRTATAAELIYAQQREPSNAPYWIAAAASLVWIVLCAYYAGYNLGDEFSTAGSFGQALTSPPILALLAVAGGPIILLWAFAVMVRRTQELRYAARSMTEAAVRLMQPEDIALESVSSVGRAIRREVTAIGEGVERALARAIELEVLVQSEITNLERSYTDSEIKLRGLVGELTEERESIELHADQLRNSLSDTHSGLAGELDAAGLRIQDVIDNATTALTGTLESRHHSITATLAEAGENLTELLSRTGAELQAKMAASGEAFGSGVDAKSTELSDRITAAGDTLNEVLEDKVRTIDTALSTQGTALVETLGVKAEALDKLLAERANQINTTVDGGLGGLVEGLGAKAVDLDNVLNKHSDQIVKVVDNRVGVLVEGLETHAQALDKVMSDRTGAIGNIIGEKLSGFGQSLTGRVDEMVDRLTDKTKELSETTDRVEEAVNQRTNALSETLMARTKEIAASFNDGEARLAGTIEQGHVRVTENMQHMLTNTTNSLDAQTERMAATLGERVDAINQALGASLAGTKDTLDAASREFHTMLSARAAELNEALDVRAIPMVENLKTVGNEVTTRLEQASNVVNTSVTDILAKLGTSNEVLRTLVEKASENLGSIQNSLTQQSSELIGAFEKATHDLDLSGKLAERIETQMGTTAESMLTNITSVSERLDEQSGILSEATKLIDAAQSNFASTLDERQTALKDLSDGLIKRTTEIDMNVNALAQSVTRMAEDANTRSRELGGVVSTEVAAAINETTARFSAATDAMKVAARDISAELEQTREQMRRGVLELPDETRQSADSMRRVVTDQIQALKDLSEIVSRSGKALDATPAAARARASAAAAAPPPPPAPSQPVFQPPQPAPAAAPVASPPLGTPQAAAQANPFTPPPRPAAQPAPATRASGGTRPTGWVSDLLRRASADEPAPPPPPRQQPPQAGERSPVHVVESLNALSMDIAKAIDHEASVDLWDRYQRGERDVFTRRLYTLQGQRTFDEIHSKYQREPEFRAAVDRYIEDFERLLADVSRNDRDNIMTQTYLTSDTGKVYTMLAHAAGRFGR